MHKYKKITIQINTFHYSIPIATVPDPYLCTLTAKMWDVAGPDPNRVSQYQVFGGCGGGETFVKQVGCNKFEIPVKSDVECLS